MLMLSYGQGLYQITGQHLKASIKDTEDTKLFWYQPNVFTASAVLSAIFVSALTVYFIFGGQG